MAPEGSSIVVSHIGLCVSDLERSMRFYCDGLGFATQEVHEVDNLFADALEVQRDVVLTSQFIRKDGMAIELLHFRSPGTVGSPSTHRNQLGLTHLSFVVPDLEQAAAALVAAGGTVLAPTRVKDPNVDLMFLSDPDGTRIEIMQYVGGS